MLMGMTSVQTAEYSAGELYETLVIYIFIKGTDLAVEVLIIKNKKDGFHLANFVSKPSYCTRWQHYYLGKYFTV